MAESQTRKEARGGQFEAGMWGVGGEEHLTWKNGRQPPKSGDKHSWGGGPEVPSSGGNQPANGYHPLKGTGPRAEAPARRPSVAPRTSNYFQLKKRGESGRGLLQVANKLKEKDTY